MKFFKCEHCGNVTVLLVPVGVPMTCCGQRMSELAVNQGDAPGGKHIPAVTVKGNGVSVMIGEQEHPMLPDHRIEFVYLETAQGGQYKSPKIGRKPEAEFTLATGDTPIAAYEYCNLHGLWKKDI
ncbi:superoxide reductase [Clostridia bacterium]|nr:superoxide reductase [Clostridia bacterium]